MSYIQRSVEHLAEVLQSKNEDYTANMGEFYNFEKAAHFVGGGMDPLSVMLTQIGIKVTRIEALRTESYSPNFEPFKDSLLDLAGYALIAHAFLSRETEKDEVREELLRIKYNPTRNHAG